MARRLWFAFSLLLLTPALAALAADDDPLPAGAKARLGTARLRFETYPSAMLSPDGKTLHTTTNLYLPRFDPVTGAPQGKLSRAFSGSIAAISADGNRLVRVSFGNVTVWDVAADKSIVNLQRTLLPFDAGVGLSDDGKTLALGGTATGGKTSILLWDVDANKEAKTVALPYNQGAAVAVSADGKMLATWGSHNDPEGKNFVDPEKNLNRYVLFWDAATGKELAKFRTSGYTPQGVTFSPDGALAAVSNGNGTVDLVDPKTGASKHTLLGRSQMGRWVAFSPDGATVAASSDDGVVRRWKVADGNILSTTEPPAAKMSGARVRLLSGEKGMAWGVKNSTVLVWEVPSGKLLSPGGGHTSAVRSLAVSADSKFVVTSSDDGTVLKWELETGKPAGTVMQPVTTAYSPGPVLSPDFTRALTRDYGSFALYDVATAKQQYVIPTPPEGFSTVTFTPDGSKVVVASPGNTFRKALAHVDVWDVRAGKRLLGVDLAGSGYAGAALTPDGKHLLTAVSKLTDKGPGDAVVTAWELAGGAKKGEATVEGGYTTPQVAPAADNKTVAVVTGTGKLVAVEFATGQVTKTFDLKQSLAGPSLFSPDGKLLAVTGSAAPFAEDRAAPVLVLDWPAGTVKHTFSAKHGMPNAMVFSPDGKYLVTGSNDGTATVWELGK